MSVQNRFKRAEDIPLVTGHGSFTDDITGNDDDMHMYVLRSMNAAGRIVAVSTDEARTLPGVVAVLTGADWKAEGLSGFVSRIMHPGPDGAAMRCPDGAPIATDRVVAVGDALAIVIARTRSQAEDAADAIVVEIDPAEAVTGIEAALAPDAPRVWPQFPDNLCFRVNKGDRSGADAAFASAAHVIRQRLNISRVTAAALEPRAARASFDAVSRRFTLSLGTQTPHRIASDLAGLLGVEAGDIRIIGKTCGGSFGMKNFGYPEYALALWAARKLGRPVRWTANRVESFMSDAHGRDQLVDAALALDAEGRFTGLDVIIRASLGARLGPSSVHPPVANLGGLTGVYRTPAIHVTVEGVFTNCQQTAPYRGAGRPEATYVIERLVDLAADKLGLDRAELRRRNMITPDQMPYKTPLVFTYDSGDFPAILDRALKLTDWDGFEARRIEAQGRNRLRGIGIANPIEIAGGPATTPNPEYAYIELTPDAGTILRMGSSDAGQGHATCYRLLVQEQLGLDPDKVTVIVADTDQVPRGTGTFGSRTLAAAGTSLTLGIRRIIEELKADAGKLLEAAGYDIEFVQGKFSVSGTDRAVSIDEVLARRAMPVSAETFAPTDGATYPNGCHICELEIDPDTGAIDLLRYLVVDDVGRVLNPAIVKGQITGGVAQGIGQALGEQIVHDPATGQLLTASFMDYTMPRAVDIPPIEIVSHPVETTRNPLGVKGAGEAGTVGAIAAVMSAVADALRPLGIKHVDMPASPGRLWQVMNSAAKD